MYKQYMHVDKILFELDIYREKTTISIAFKKIKFLLIKVLKETWFFCSHLHYLAKFFEKIPNE